jgi:hypothetical protein
MHEITQLFRIIDIHAMSFSPLSFCLHFFYHKALFNNSMHRKFTHCYTLIPPRHPYVIVTKQCVPSCLNEKADYLTEYIPFPPLLNFRLQTVSLDVKLFLWPKFVAHRNTYFSPFIPLTMLVCFLTLNAYVRENTARMTGRDIHTEGVSYPYKEPFPVGRI